MSDTGTAALVCESGWDRGRSAVQVFRLGRIANPCEVLRPRAGVDRARRHRRARARSRLGLRARPGASPCSGCGPGERRPAPGTPVSRTARRVGAGMGPWSPRGSPTSAGSPTTPPRSAPDAVVLDPPDLREAVIRRLKESWRDRSCHLDRAAAAAARAGAYVMSRKSGRAWPRRRQAFGISERELVDDLNLLWCVELRSPRPLLPDRPVLRGAARSSSARPSPWARPLRLARRRGQRAAGRAADAGRGARAPRTVRRCPG